MIEFDARALLLGLALGLPASALYFAGLAWGMRRALRSRAPGALLLLSFLVRAGLLLGLVLWALRLAPSLWLLAGYLAAFVLVRQLAVWRARASAAAG